eukprot:9011368-Karenia_brevis.AAC.1
MRQVAVNKKCKQAGTDLYMIEDEEERPPQVSVQKYLSNLFTYLLALALAGSSKVSDAPTEPEASGYEPHRYVHAP